MAQVKISRKKLLQEPDEFLSLSQKVWLWVHAHRDRTLMVAGGIAAVVLAAVIGKGALERSREKRADAVSTAIARYGTAAGAAAVPAVPAEQSREFATLADRYAGSPQGVVARYFQAGSLAAAGEREKARPLFAALAAPAAGGGDIALLARVALAYLDLAGGSPDAALKAFQELLTVQDVAVPRAQIMLEIAGIHEKQGHPAEARRVYQDLLAAHPDGSWATPARERLRQLAGTPTAS